MQDELDYSTDEDAVRRAKRMLDRDLLLSTRYFQEDNPFELVDNIYS